MKDGDGDPRQVENWRRIFSNTVPTVYVLGEDRDRRIRRKVSCRKHSLLVPVIGAVDFGHYDLVQWLLDQGAHPNARSNIGSRGTVMLHPHESNCAVTRALAVAR